MTEAMSRMPMKKGRSASICAPGASLDTFRSTLETPSSRSQTNSQSNSGRATPTKRQTPEPSPTPPNPSTPQTPTNRRKPAARSQSARIANGRSIRRRQPPLPQPINGKSSPSGSEPRLVDDVSPGLRRRGSRRGMSMYQHRKSTAFLDVPSTRAYQGQAKSEDDEGVNPEDEDAYRLRSFSSTSKGIVNRGDSFRRRRSRSSSLCPGHPGFGFVDRETPPRSPARFPATIDDETPQLTDRGVANGVKARRNPKDEVNVNEDDTKKYKVALLGAAGVGKAALISQFMTSECINAYEGTRDDLNDEQIVPIMLDGEESELEFVKISNVKLEIDKSEPPDAYVVVYSVVDRSSLVKAEAELKYLNDQGLLRGHPVLIVGNKIDLARSRTVSTQDGKYLACTHRGKFIEISVGINHNVDELLVGILQQIRLKEKQQTACGYHGSDAQWFKSRGVLRASIKARQMFTWIFGKEDSKLKNCENLHVL